MNLFIFSGKYCIIFLQVVSIFFLFFPIRKVTDFLRQSIFTVLYKAMDESYNKIESVRLYVCFWTKSNECQTDPEVKLSKEKVCQNISNNKNENVNIGSQCVGITDIDILDHWNSRLLFRMRCWACFSLVFNSTVSLMTV